MTNSKFPNEKNEAVLRGVTKKNRLFLIIFLSVLDIFSLVLSILLICKDISNIWSLILPVIFYGIFYMYCNFSLILCFILYLAIKSKNQYIRLLHSYYFGYNLSQEIIARSNKIVKKCFLYSELHKTLFKSVYQIETQRKEPIFLTIRWQKVEIKYMQTTITINGKFKERDLLLEEIVAKIISL
jgi:sporulation killing factor system integral membrane protein